MAFHCQNSPKLLLQIENYFNPKIVLSSHSTKKKVLPQFQGFSSCTNATNVDAGLKMQGRQATPLSFMLHLVCRFAKSHGEIRMKNIMRTSSSHCRNGNKTFSTPITNPHAFNSNCNLNSREGFLSLNHSITQPIHLSSSFHTCTSSNEAMSKANNLDNNSSTHYLYNFPSPTPPKRSSFQGSCSHLLNCNNQLFSSTRCGLHISAQCRDIYIIESEEEFEKKVMDSKLPVVINFHADWCEPCHALKPLLESLADKYQGRMHLAEVKVDDHVALLHAFEVTAVPAVLGVVKGQVTEKFVGLISEPEVRAFVNTMIGE